jgi:hypothetical protein
VSIQSAFRCFAILGAIALGVATPRQAVSQSGATPPASASAQSNPFAPIPAVKRVSISKSVFGDAGMIVNARDDGFIELAAAGPSKTIFIQLRTLAARAWVDSTARMMKAKVKKTDPPRAFRSDISEFGSTTTMALTRAVNAGESEYALRFAENPQSSFTVPIEESEAEVFVAIVRKAVAQSAKLLEKTDTTAARADSIARADSAAAAAKKKKPAAKRPASPPVKDSTAKKDSTSKTPAAKAPAAKAPVKP